MQESKINIEEVTCARTHRRSSLVKCSAHLALTKFCPRCLPSPNTRKGHPLLASGPKFIHLPSSSTKKKKQYIGQLKPQLADVVYNWCKGASFLEISQQSDIYEGQIIRGMRRLDELLKQMESASKVIGNTVFLPCLGSFQAPLISSILKRRQWPAEC